MLRRVVLGGEEYEGKRTTPNTKKLNNTKTTHQLAPHPRIPTPSPIDITINILTPAPPHPPSLSPRRVPDVTMRTSLRTDADADGALDPLPIYATNERARVGEG